jgi:uncharacterized protein YndB with AHSA1/START domain
MKLNILLVEDFPHPVEKVWQGLTNPEAISVWLMENDFEPRVGKRFILRGREIPSRSRGWVECEVLELETPHRMVWSWVHEGGESPTRVEFRLDPIVGGTRLTLSHTGEIDPLIGSRLTDGWPGKLADLRALLSRPA